jgi:hypothetical protein
MYRISHFQQAQTFATCSISRDSLTGCIPGDNNCQCPQCGYGDILIILFQSNSCQSQETSAQNKYTAKRGRTGLMIYIYIYSLAHCCTPLTRDVSNIREAFHRLPFVMNHRANDPQDVHPKPGYCCFEQEGLPRQSTTACMKRTCIARSCATISCMARPIALESCICSGLTGSAGAMMTKAI